VGQLEAEQLEAGQQETEQLETEQLDASLVIGLNVFFWWRGLIHSSKGARTAAASTPLGPRARL
jgi:hypothetical protein